MQEVDLFIQKIQSVKLIPEKEYGLIWKATGDGYFTVSSLYKIIITDQSVQIQKLLVLVGWYLMKLDTRKLDEKGLEHVQ